MKKLDSDWLIKKTFVKVLCKHFENIKLKICNDNILINDNFQINLTDNVFVDKDLLFYNTYYSDKKAFIRFAQAYNRLPLKERKIFYWCFIDKEKEYSDDYIANDLGFSLGYFYIIKKTTILDFATSIGVTTI